MDRRLFGMKVRNWGIASIVGGVLIAVEETARHSYNAHTNFSNNVIPDFRSKGERNGELVFSEANGTPQQYVEYWRMYHGGITSVKRIREDTSGRRFGNFFKHHNAIFDHQKRRLNDIGPERYRSLVEGLSGTPDQWDDKAHNLFEAEEYNRLWDEYSSNPDARYIIERVMWEQFKQGSEIHGVGVLQACNAGYRFAAHCSSRGLNDVVIGADPPDHYNIDRLFHDRWNQLINAGEMPSDEEIDEFIEWFDEKHDEDEKIRHDYIRDVIRNESMPEHAIVSVVLGSSHGKEGVKHANESDLMYPLEDALLEIPDTQVDVYDPHYLDKLVITKADPGKKLIIVGAKGMKREDIKRYLSLIHEQRQLQREIQKLQRSGLENP